MSANRVRDLLRARWSTIGCFLGLESLNVAEFVGASASTGSVGDGANYRTARKEASDEV